MRPPSTLLARVLPPVLLAVVCPAIGLVLWLGWRTEGALLADAGRDLEARAGETARAIEGAMAAPVQRLLWLALTPEIQDLLAHPGDARRRDRAGASLAAYLHRNGLAGGMVYDEHGRLLAAAGRSAPAAAHAEPWFVGAVSEFAIPGGLTPVHVRRQDGDGPGLRYACAVLRADNAIGGVLAIDADLAALLPAGGRWTLADAAGRRIAGDEPGPDCLQARAQVRLAGQPEADAVLTLHRPHGEVLAGIRSAQSAVAAATMLGALLAAGAAILGLRRATRPLAALAAGVRSLGSRGIAAPLPAIDGPREVRDIADALAGLRQAVRAQQQALADGAERLRVVAEFAADWEMWVAPDGSCRHCSPSVRELTGLPPEAFLADPGLWRSLIHPDDRTAAGVGGADGDGPHRSTWRLLRPDGGVRWVEQVARRVHRADGADLGWRATIRDVTRRRELETQLAHAQRVQALGRLAGGVAHDVNNLLAIIGGQAGLLARERPGCRRTASIAQAVERGADLTRRLLAVSRRQVRSPVVHDLGPVVADAAALLDRTIGGGVSVTADCADGPLPVLCDRSEMDQVLMNLVINARDAMPDGGTVALRLRRDGREAVLTVQDEGVGMDAAVLARLFQPYFTTKPAGKGTGLGLALVQANIEAAGGSVAAASRPGEGSVFTIRLPIAPAAAPGPGPVRLAGHVVLAEDDPDLRAVVHEGLAAAGAEVTAVEDGDRVAGALRPDATVCLVLDLRMARLGGLEALRRARAEMPAVPAVLVSGWPGDQGPEGGLPAGTRFLAKPFTAAALAGEVAALLGADPPGTVAA